MRLWYLSHRQTAKAQARLRRRQSLRCSHTQSMKEDKGSDQHRKWIAAYACLKIEFTEGDKCHNLMSRLN